MSSFYPLNDEGYNQSPGLPDSLTSTPFVTPFQSTVNKGLGDGIPEFA